MRGGTLNIVAQPKTAKKLAATQALQISTGWPVRTPTGSGEIPDTAATNQTPIAIARTTIAAYVSRGRPVSRSSRVRSNPAVTRGNPGIRKIDAQMKPAASRGLGLPTTAVISPATATYKPDATAADVRTTARWLSCSRVSQRWSAYASADAGSTASTSRTPPFDSTAIEAQARAMSGTSIQPG